MKYVKWICTLISLVLTAVVIVKAYPTVYDKLKPYEVEQIGVPSYAIHPTELQQAISMRDISVVSSGLAQQTAMQQFNSDGFVAKNAAGEDVKINSGWLNKFVRFWTMRHITDEEVASPIGLLTVVEQDANMRTSIDIQSDANIDYQMIAGSVLPFSEVGDLSGTPWYGLNYKDTQQLHWLSSKVATVTASFDVEPTEEQVEKAEAFVIKLYEHLKVAFKQEDMTIMQNVITADHPYYNIELTMMEKRQSIGYIARVRGYELADVQVIDPQRLLVRVNYTERVGEDKWFFGDDVSNYKVDFIVNEVDGQYQLESYLNTFYAEKE